MKCAFLLALRQKISQGRQRRKQKRNDVSLVSSTPGNPEVFEAVMRVKAISHRNFCITANVNSFVQQAGKA